MSRDTRSLVDLAERIQSLPLRLPISVALRRDRKGKGGKMNGSSGNAGVGTLAGTGVGLMTIFGLTISEVRLFAVGALLLFVVGAVLIRVSYRRRSPLSRP